MELKLVYRALRKISDWTLAGFFSEVYVEGQRNVGKDGPLIIASTHHNEIIDIATLAATIPHRRHLSFWAKSSMFANPITRAILESSGAIPVRRNPNNGGSASSSAATNTNTTQTSLFRDTSTALASGGVIGVFPEGTSYTQPGIAQVLPGAAWTAVEYVRWVRATGKGKREGEEELTIVPTTIVYTDKARYLSRIVVRYGTPIVTSTYIQEVFEDDRDVRDAVKTIMAEVERQMKEMSVNAPGWDTLYAANMAREILWEDEKNIPLKDWVEISQTLVNLFTPPPNPTTHEIYQLDAVIPPLTRYHALLYHTGIKHYILNSLLPTTSSSIPFSKFPRTLLLTLPKTLLGLFLFTPPLLLHIPAYITGTLAARCFGGRRDEETKAQYKAVGGGVGFGIGVGIFLGLMRRVSRLVDERKWAEGVLDSMGEKRWWVESMLGWIEKTGWMGKALGVYVGVRMMVRWHNALVLTAALYISGNYKRLKTFLTFWKLLGGLSLPLNKRLNEQELKIYTRSPQPPRNSFIKNVAKSASTVASSSSSSSSAPSPTSPTNEMEVEVEPKPIASTKLIRPLLDARGEAVSALGAFLREFEKSGGGGREDGGLIQFLWGKGARVP
ncbi:Glycerol-3-phosphate O-acyltransferase 1 [Hypsizygus marmoreus]|uniref:Glycerol-3-phosphate O-acyltransferase 1 n=1 Tax=Hypsizygus marmoreus TaxID=39966 RepID=A0A369K0S4_HYPMA|nr:Glycerol-3-phosphate O-acyltransferase 1 [Hypsizygus marmoreus]